MRLGSRHRPPTPEGQPRLELIKGGGREANPSYRLIFGFLALATAVLGGLVYFSPGTRWRWGDFEAQFLTLDQTYRSRGLEAFQQQKAQLKQTITEVLSNGNAAEVASATNIAVFLFPDVLTGDNFEKSVAEELWGASIREIENHPNTTESRVLFEDMRANIWNYEQADREDPKLSPAARQVIQIFDALSTP